MPRRTPVPLVGPLPATSAVLALAAAGLLGAVAPLAAGAAPARSAPTTASIDVAAVDRYVAGQMAELHIPGLALALVADGEVAYERGYGVADPSGRAVTPATPFILGSTSKQFTGIAVEQLIRAGRLVLDAPVARYLPWFGSGSDPHAQVTIKELLAHTSGIGPSSGAANMLEDGGPGDTLAAYAHRLANEPLANAPGSTWVYADSNYDLLGYLVEVLSGEPYADYMRRHVFEPLGLHGTYADKAAAEAHGLAAGFYPWFGLLSLPTPMPYPRGHLPSGYLISSAHDLASLALAQLGRVPQGQTEVTGADLAATRVSLTNDAADIRYAAGWLIHRFWEGAADGQEPNDPALPLFYGHAGHVATYASFVGFVPATGFGLALTMNADDRVGNAQDRWANVAEAVMGVALGRPPSTAPVSDDLVMENARLLYLLVLAVQVAACAWALRARRRRRLAMGVAAVVNAAALALVLVYAPARSDTPLLVVVRLNPDVGLVTAISVAVAVAWLALEVWQWYRQRRSARTAPISGA